MLCMPGNPVVAQGHRDTELSLLGKPLQHGVDVDVMLGVVVIPQWFVDDVKLCSACQDRLCVLLQKRTHFTFCMFSLISLTSPRSFLPFLFLSLFFPFLLSFQQSVRLSMHPSIFIHFSSFLPLSPPGCLPHSLLPSFPSTPGTTLATCPFEPWVYNSEQFLPSWSFLSFPLDPIMPRD